MQMENQETTCNIVVAPTPLSTRWTVTQMEKFWEKGWNNSILQLFTRKKWQLKLQKCHGKSCRFLPIRFDIWPGTLELDSKNEAAELARNLNDKEEKYREVWKTWEQCMRVHICPLGAGQTRAQFLWNLEYRMELLRKETPSIPIKSVGRSCGEDRQHIWSLADDVATK